MAQHPICQKCGAWAECKSPRIQGAGSETPEVLFIGETPTNEEDQKNKPFINDAGELVHTLCQELNLTHYRVTYAVKCRPPANKLKGPELDFCKKFLYEEILKYRPKVIVTLGTNPIKAMTGATGVMGVRGEGQSWKLAPPDYDPVILPIVSPASLKFRPENFNLIVQDFNLIPILLRQEKTPIKENHIIVQDLETLVDVTQKCLTTDRLAIDTETTGLNVYQGAKVFIISLSWAPGEACAIPLDDTNIPAPMLMKYIKKIMGSQVPKYFHNARFDVEQIEMGLGIEINNLVGDTMIAQFLTDETTKRGLKYLSGKYLGVYKYDQPIAEWFKANPKEKKMGMLTVPKDLIYPYACKDADYTRRLSYIKEEELASAELNNPKDKLPGLECPIPNMLDLYKNHMMPLVRTCIDLREAGIKVDMERLNMLNEEYKREIQAIDDELNTLPEAIAMCKNGGNPPATPPSEVDLADVPNTPVKKTSVKPLDKFLLSSPSQVATLLFDYLGLPYIEGRSTNKHVLFEHAKTSQVASKLLEYRKKYKMLSSFITPMYELMDRGGFARPEVLPDGTRSGRTSCRNPNLQQSPWDSRVRGIYCTRFKDGNLVLIDYSQIELRVMAMLSGDPTMSKMYTELDENGKAKDFHKETAAIVYEVPVAQVEDWQRRFIKTVNFGIAYGRGAEAIAVQFDKSIEYCRQIVKQWWERFPILRKWRDGMHQFVQTKKYIRTPYGRMRRLPEIMSDDPKTANTAKNGAINSPVQGTAADICCEAMIKLNNYRRANKCKFKIVMVIHDSIMFDVPPEEMHLIQEVFVPTMEGISHPWMRGIPITTSCKTADNWGDMEEMVMHMEGEGQDKAIADVLSNEDDETETYERTY